MIVFMIIFWSGFGFLVPLITIICFVITQATVNAMVGEKHYEANAWPKMAAAIFSAILVGLFGYIFNRTSSKRTVIRPETGERYVITVPNGGGHTFFFIPMEYWSVILVILGVALLFAK
ncbi:MAG: hypothetical protein QM703_23400 [Gemmatales bacterium]